MLRFQNLNSNPNTKLSKVLSRMVMEEAFSDEADFTGMLDSNSRMENFICFKINLSLEENAFDAFNILHS